MAVLVKTRNGTAFASIKTLNGLAVASMKTMNGLDTTAGSSLITNIASASGASTNTNTVTTGSLSIAGANFVVGICSYYDFGGGQPAISDSNGHTDYTTKTVYSTVYIKTFIFYRENFTDGGSITVTGTSSPGGTYPAIAVWSFANVKASASFDAENGGSAASSTSFQPGSITPAGNDELLVAGFNLNTLAETITVNSGYSTPLTVNATGNCCGVSGAYLIQTTGGAVNPTFSWTTAKTVSGAAAAFKNT